MPSIKARLTPKTPELQIPGASLTLRYNSVMWSQGLGNRFVQIEVEEAGEPHPTLDMRAGSVCAVQSRAGPKYRLTCEKIDAGPQGVGGLATAEGPFVDILVTLVSEK